MSLTGSAALKNGAYLTAVAIALYLMSLYSELLYHTTVEVFCMVVAAAVLIVAWNGRRLLDNDYLLLIGFAYLSFALIDLPHMLSFEGISIFRGYGPELTDQLYMAQRLILALSFLLAPYFLTHRLPPYLTAAAYVGISAVALATIFFAPFVLDLSLTPTGTTDVRLLWDGAVVALFAVAIAGVVANRRFFDPDVLWLLVATMAFFIASQVAFALGTEGRPSGLFAHFTQGLAVFLTYKAVVEMAFVRPEALLYRDLATRERAERVSSEQYQHVADTLQTALLQVPERLEGVAIVSRYLSSSEVARIGGDFYDVFEIDNRRVGFALGDVSGKGLEAATTTAEVKSTVRAYAYLRADPSFVLSKTSDVMYRLLGEAQFVTALFGVLDTVSGSLEIASAGHEEPVVCVRSACEFLEIPTNLPLGVGFGVHYSGVRTGLMLGDGLLAYTDGIPDARRGEERFGRDRLRSIIERSDGVPPHILADQLLDAVTRFSGGVLADDIAVLGLELTRPDPQAASVHAGSGDLGAPVVAGR